MITEPATAKFIYYWFLQGDKYIQANKIKRLLDMSDDCLNKFLEDTKIDPASFDLDKSIKTNCLMKLEGIDTRLACENFIAKHKKDIELQKETPIYGQKALNE